MTKAWPIGTTRANDLNSGKRHLWRTIWGLHKRPLDSQAVDLCQSQIHLIDWDNHFLNSCWFPNMPPGTVWSDKWWRSESTGNIVCAHNVSKITRPRNKCYYYARTLMLQNILNAYKKTRHRASNYGNGTGTTNNNYLQDHQLAQATQSNAPDNKQIQRTQGFQTSRPHQMNQLHDWKNGSWMGGGATMLLWLTWKKQNWKTMAGSNYGETPELVLGNVRSPE
jgi:hypothetical protein